jgi:hypothetical protein
MRLLRIFLVTVVLSCPAVEQQRPTEPEKTLTGPVQSFDPSRQKALRFKDESVEIRLVTGRERHLLEFRKAPAKVGKRVALPIEMVQVDELRRGVNNKLVVRGMVNASGSQVAIFDLGSSNLIDKFFCYLPRISPDGHYVAFIKFYPAHFAGKTESHFMVYDLGKTPWENRPAGIPATDDWNVGKSVYPVGMGNRPGDNTELPNRPVHASVSAGVFWNASGKQFLLADRLDPGEVIDLVLVEIGPDGEFSVKTVQQALQELCSTMPGQEKAVPCSVLVRDVEFKSPRGPFVVRFQIVGTAVLKALEYRYSQFRIVR